MRRALSLVAAVSLTALVACSYFRGDTSPSRVSIDAADEQVTSGEDLYVRDCAWCHGDGGEGTSLAPDLVSGTNGRAFTEFMLSTGRMPITDPDTKSARRDPVYTDAQIAAIVDYVGDLGAPGPDIPDVDPSHGDLGEGLELYQENCAACHAPTLIGGALTRGRTGEGRSVFVPDLMASSATEIAEAMLVGPGPMPVFSEETFTDEQFDSIVAYVVAQQDPTDRGGAPIGHIGPVAEGAVGILLGLGAALVLARWIGTKIGEL